MDKPVQIRLFGAFEMRVGDEVVPESAWRLRKGKSLVKLLALSPDRRVHRERATELLWPDRKPESAANNFHQALYVARRALEGAGADAARALPLRDDMLLLHPDGAVEIDVDAFEAAVARAHESGALGDYRAALELHGGELLPEDRFEPWAADRREALAEAHLGLLLELSGRLMDAGDSRAAIAVLEEAVVIDPLHEAAHRALMRLFAATGRRQQALAQFHRLRGSLRRDLEAEPDPQTAELYRALLRGEVEVGPAGEDELIRAAPKASRPPAPARPRHHLPIALTSFVGRERELGEVARLLDRDRLVTLTGAGGAGKTRLALETARARSGGYRDGVWLVELAGLGDPALVPGATASALGLTLPSQRPDLEELSAQLAGWEALVILDNCEHLVGACAPLAERLLATCPSLRILTTSREPLRVTGEVTWRVPSLGLPPGNGRLRAADLEGYESVRLFCERAADVAPSFALDDDNAQPVAHICLRLDGMPLAIELAAARAGSLSPMQIAERLGDSLAVLTAGSRAALDRQQTLRATLNWSHDLLSSDERVLFRRLAVFAGSFSLPAAETVTSDEQIASNDVADLLARLVDKSLVVADEARDGYRYRLLESMRQYGAERLREADEAAEFGSRHCDYYLALAAAADPEVATNGPVSPTGLLEADHDNLRAGMAWALRHDPERALRLAVHMWPMWMDGAHYREGSRLLGAALAAAPDPTELRAEALRAMAGLHVRLGQSEGFTRLGEERLAIFEELGDRRSVAHALDELGVYEYMVGEYDQAEQLYERSLALARELPDPQAAAATLHSIGVLAQCRGELRARTRGTARQPGAAARATPGDREPFFRVHTVGLFVAAGGPGQGPRMFFEETLQFFRRVDARSPMGFVLAALGDVARAAASHRPGARAAGESLAHFREARRPDRHRIRAQPAREPCRRDRRVRLGREWLEEALGIRRELGDRRGIGLTLGNLGVLPPARVTSTAADDHRARRSTSSSAERRRPRA